MTTIETLVAAFERGRLSRRELVQGLAAMVTAAAAPAAAQTAPAIPALSLNPVSLAVADPEASKQFFQRTFGMPVASTQGTGINLALGTSFPGLYRG